MQYRLATIADWPAISEYVHGRDYFMPMDPATLGGHWVIAVEEGGKVRGTIWTFGQAPNAYVDYWAGDTGLIAARVAARLEQILRASGIQHVRAAIYQENDAAVRLAAGLGMSVRSGDYILAYRRL